jgi:hypothetical protein
MPIDVTTAAHTLNFPVNHPTADFACIKAFTLAFVNEFNP